MINIITSNPTDIKSIHGYHDNFIIVHLSEATLIPMSMDTVGYNFHVYHQDRMDLSEYDEYQSSSNMRFQFHPVRNIIEALDKIIENIVQAEERARTEAQRFNENQEEIMIASVCDMSWNKQGMKYIDSELAQRNCESSCLNLYQYLRVGSIERLAEILKARLRSDFVYPEDPVAFSYAIMRVLNGGT